GFSLALKFIFPNVGAGTGAATAGAAIATAARATDRLTCCSLRSCMAEIAPPPADRAVPAARGPPAVAVESATAGSLGTTRARTRLPAAMRALALATVGPGRLTPGRSAVARSARRPRDVLDAWRARRRGWGELATERILEGDADAGASALR